MRENINAIITNRFASYSSIPFWWLEGFIKVWALLPFCTQNNKQKHVLAHYDGHDINKISFYRLKWTTGKYLRLRNLTSGRTPGVLPRITSWPMAALSVQCLWTRMQVLLYKLERRGNILMARLHNTVNFNILFHCWSWLLHVSLISTYCRSWRSTSIEWVLTGSSPVKQWCWPFKPRSTAVSTAHVWTDCASRSVLKTCMILYHTSSIL